MKCLLIRYSLDLISSIRDIDIGDILTAKYTSNKEVIAVRTITVMLPVIPPLS